MILLLGATGYVGQAFADELRTRQLEFVPLSRRAIDYTQFDLLFNYVRKTKPEFLINAAGYIGGPNIDTCETARAQTVKANTLLPQTIARVCYLTRTSWGHVSSGCIYSGARITRNGASQTARDLNLPEIRRRFEIDPDAFKGFTESDAPNFSFRSPPCSFYSGTKALGEEALRWCDHAYLWRPRMLFDGMDHQRNFLSKLQRYPRVLDGVNSLSHRQDFVRACMDLWERRASFGAYHIVNPGALATRHVIELLQRSVCRDRQFQFWNDDREFYRLAARAPRANCILDCSKLQEAGIHLRPVQAAIEDSLANWRVPAQNSDHMNSLLNSPAARHA